MCERARPQAERAGTGEGGAPREPARRRSEAAPAWVAGGRAEPSRELALALAPRQHGREWGRGCPQKDPPDVAAGLHLSGLVPVGKELHNNNPHAFLGASWPARTLIPGGMILKKTLALLDGSVSV